MMRVPWWVCCGAGAMVGYCGESAMEGVPWYGTMMGASV